MLGDDGFMEFANGMLDVITILDAGVGDTDTIIAGGGGDIVFGGAGSDSITLGDGNNIVFGHDGTAAYLDGQVSLLAVIDPSVSGDVQITTGSGADWIFGGAGANTINAGDGDNVVIGASGQMMFDSGQLTQISTTNATVGGASMITAGAGNDIILGGTGATMIDAGSGTNVIIGHNGFVDVSNGLPNNVQSTDPGQAGAVTITVGAGNDVILAGSGPDTITTGAGNHVILADNGLVQFDELGRPTFAEVLYSDSGDVDTISTGAGNNVIFRGVGNDTITGTGTNVVLDGNAFLDLTTGGPFWQAATTSPPAANPASPPLTVSALAVIVAEAREIWGEALGANSVLLTTLDKVHVDIGDLPDGMLGATFGDTIIIDAAAAGWGWFIDPTPRANGEFAAAGSSGALAALAASPAAGQMDLLSVVLHETGNAMGFAEDGGQDVMGKSLAAGVRTLPLTAPELRASDAAAPRIAWNVDAGTSPSATKRTGFAVPSWLNDFVQHLGKDAADRNPNAGLKINLPIVGPPA